MMQQAAIGLGLPLRLLSEAPDASAAQVIADVTVGDYTDEATLARFASGCDVLTFDHEHVPTAHLHRLEDGGTAVRPGPDALVFAQDKARMRARLGELGAPCPEFEVCADADELIRFGERVGWPIIAKTSRGGYDGKGVWRVEGPDDSGEPFVGLPRLSAGEPVQIVAEEFIDFSRELSALVVRSASGQVVSYPISETVQREGVCRETVTPAPDLAEDVATGLQHLALRIASELGVVGVLAVEHMQARDGRIVVNELAMRPHNTGHWTIDGAATSQFENHLRAVADLPLGSPAMLADTVAMVNVLGGSRDDLVGGLRHCFAHDNALRVQIYGKQVNPGRKVGHVTALGPDALERARHAAAYLMGEIND